MCIQSLEGFLYTAQRQGQIHTDVVRTMEGSSVLPINTNIPASFHQFFHGFARFRAPLLTI